MKKISILLALMMTILFSFSYIHAQEVIDGADEVLIPNAGESIAQYEIPKGYIFDELSLIGVRLDAQGLLTVTHEAIEQDLIISASYHEKIYQKEIHLRYSWSREKAEFQKYQIKEKIEPISLPQLFIDSFFIQSVRYLILGISVIIFIAYLIKRREKD